MSIKQTYRNLHSKRPQKLQNNVITNRGVIWSDTNQTVAYIESQLFLKKSQNQDLICKGCALNSIALLIILTSTIDKDKYSLRSFHHYTYL